MRKKLWRASCVGKISDRGQVSIEGQVRKAYGIREDNGESCGRTEYEWYYSILRTFHSRLSRSQTRHGRGGHCFMASAWMDFRASYPNRGRLRATAASTMVASLSIADRPTAPYLFTLQGFNRSSLTIYPTRVNIITTKHSNSIHLESDCSVGD